MNKIMMIMTMLAGVCLAQQYSGQAPIVKIDTSDPNNTYIGTAYATASDSTSQVSTNDASWEIVKLTKTAGVTTGIYMAVTEKRGDASMRTSVWADRASTNTVYKTAE